MLQTKLKVAEQRAAAAEGRLTYTDTLYSEVENGGTAYEETSPLNSNTSHTMYASSSSDYTGPRRRNPRLGSEGMAHIAPFVTRHKLVAAAVTTVDRCVLVVIRSQAAEMHK